MPFANFGLTEEEIRRLEKEDREYWENARREREQINEEISRMHEQHIGRMRQLREKSHRQFLRYIEGRRY